MIPKQGAEWLIVKNWLFAKIDEAHSTMDGGVTFDHYNSLCGQVALARELIEKVEPTRPPLSQEDDYGISQP